MLTRTLVFTNRYFQGNYQKLKQGYFIPGPPSKPKSEKAVLLGLVNQHGLLKGKSKEKIALLNDQNFAKDLRKEAKTIRDKQLKDYEEQKKQYDQKFTYPKRQASSFTSYFKENFVPGQKVTDTMKSLGEAFKNLAPTQRSVYVEKAKKDSQRYEEERKAFEERNSQWRIPPPAISSGYNLFVQEQFSKNKGVKLGELSTQWKNLSEQQKSEFNKRAEDLKVSHKDVLLKFQKTNNIPEEEMKKLYQRKSRRNEDM